MSRESRLLSRILRHAPNVVGLTLEPGGWVRLEDLLRGLRAAGHSLSHEDGLLIVAENDKQRFTLSDDGQRIRAAQGHSVAVDLQLAPAVPPAVLYHGTARTSLEAILVEGLRPGRRQRVHLSPDEAIARKVGTRHGRPVLLRVNTGAMRAEGHPFRRADNGVWLTEPLPPQYTAFGAWD